MNSAGLEFLHRLQQIRGPKTASRIGREAWKAHTYLVREFKEAFVQDGCALLREKLKTELAFVPVGRAALEPHIAAGRATRGIQDFWDITCMCEAACLCFFVIDAIRAGTFDLVVECYGVVESFMVGGDESYSVDPALDFALDSGFFSRLEFSGPNGRKAYELLPEKLKQRLAALAEIMEPVAEQLRAAGVDLRRT